MVKLIQASHVCSMLKTISDTNDDQLQTNLDLSNKLSDPCTSINTFNGVDKIIFKHIDAETCNLSQRKDIYHREKSRICMTLCTHSRISMLLWKINAPLHRYKSCVYLKKIRRPNHLEPLKHADDLKILFPYTKRIKNAAKNKTQYVHFKGDTDYMPDLFTNNTSNKHENVSNLENLGTTHVSNITMNTKVNRYAGTKNYSKVKKVMTENDALLLNLVSRDTASKFAFPQKRSVRSFYSSNADFINFVYVQKPNIIRKKRSHLPKKKRKTKLKLLSKHETARSSLQESRSSSEMQIPCQTRTSRLKIKPLEVQTSRTNNVKISHQKTKIIKLISNLTTGDHNVSKESKRKFSWSSRFSKSIWIPNPRIINAKVNQSRELDSVPVKLPKEMHAIEKSIVLATTTFTEGINALYHPIEVLKFPNLRELSLSEHEKSFCMEIKLNKSIQNSFAHDLITDSLSKYEQRHSYVLSPMIKIESDNETIKTQEINQKIKISKLINKITKFASNPRFSYCSKSEGSSALMKENTTQSSVFQTVNKCSSLLFKEYQQPAGDETIVDSVKSELHSIVIALAGDKQASPSSISISTWKMASENMECNHMHDIEMDHQAPGCEIINKNVIHERHYVANLTKRVKEIASRNRSSAGSTILENDNSTTSCQLDPNKVVTIFLQSENTEQATDNNSTSEQHKIVDLKEKMKPIKRPSVCSQFLESKKVTKTCGSNSQMSETNSIQINVEDKQKHFEETSKRQNISNLKIKPKEIEGHQQSFVCNQLHEHENALENSEFVSNIEETNTIQPIIQDEPFKIYKNSKIQHHLFKTFTNDIMTIDRARRSSKSSVLICRQNLEHDKSNNMFKFCSKAVKSSYSQPNLGQHTNCDESMKNKQESVDNLKEGFVLFTRGGRLPNASKSVNKNDINNIDQSARSMEQDNNISGCSYPANESLEANGDWNSNKEQNKLTKFKTKNMNISRKDEYSLSHKSISSQISIKNKSTSHVKLSSKSIASNSFQPENLSLISYLVEADGIQLDHLDSASQLADQRLIQSGYIRPTKESLDANGDWTAKKISTQNILTNLKMVKNNLSKNKMSSLFSARFFDNKKAANNLKFDTKKIKPKHIQSDDLMLNVQTIDKNHVNTNKVRIEADGDWTINKLQNTFANFKKRKNILTLNRVSTLPSTPVCNRIVVNENAIKHLEFDWKPTNPTPVQSSIVGKPSNRVEERSRRQLRLPGFRRAKSTAETETFETGTPSELGFFRKIHERLQRISSGNRKT